MILKLIRIYKNQKGGGSSEEGGEEASSAIISVDCGHDVGGWCTTAPPRTGYYSTWRSLVRTVMNVIMIK
jgi:hypothetical protein